MPEFTAALFATRERPHGTEHGLVAHALLFESSRPCWEVHIGGKIFRFIPHPDFILEDVLWQLNNYCQIPESEYKHDVSENKPLTLEEEFGEETCKEARNNIAYELSKLSTHFKLITWPGVGIYDVKGKVKQFKDKDVYITYEN